MTRPAPEVLGDVLSGDYPRLLSALAAQYRRAPNEQLEDALSRAVIQLLERAEQPESVLGRAASRDGREGVRRLLFFVARRELRGEHRRLRNRKEQYPGVLPESRDGDDPLALLEGRRASNEVPRLVPLAALRFGRGKADAFAAALDDRLQSGDSDVAVASRHGVERSQLCRARCWIEQAFAA